jgi:hypothetical protein
VRPLTPDFFSSSANTKSRIAAIPAPTCNPLETARRLGLLRRKRSRNLS